MPGLFRDIRLASRTLRRSPGFTALATLSLALGIGLNAAVFSLVNAVLFRPLPVADQEALVSFRAIRDDGSTTASLAYPDYRYYRDHNRSFSGVLISGATNAIWRSAEGDETLNGFLVFDNYFDVLGVTPALGRFFEPNQNAAPRTQAEVVVSHEFWQTRLGADPEAIGRSLRLNGLPFEIIGVAPPRFTGLDLRLGGDFWTPVAMQPIIRPGSQHLTTHRWMQIVARLRPDVSTQQALADIQMLQAQLQAQRPDDPRQRRVSLEPLLALPQDRAAFAQAAALLQALVGLVLFIACLNIASLFLERLLNRRRELAVRQAIGGGRWQVVRPTFVEGAIIAVLGATGGLLAATFAADAYRLLPGPLGDLRLDVALDGRVLTFTASLATLAALLFAVAPLLHAPRSLKQALEREPLGGSGRSRLGVRELLIVGEAGLSLAVLVAASLSVRSLIEIASVDLGFQPDDRVLLSFDLSKHGYSDESGRLFVDRTLERLEGLPLVRSAAVTHSPPFGFEQSALRLHPPEVEGTARLAERYRVSYSQVSPSYFETMAIPLIAGRRLEDGDRNSSRRVVVVNETLAQRYWPDENPVGRLVGLPIDFETSETYEVVGVAADSKYYSLTEEPPPFAYIAVDQLYRHALTFVVHGSGGSGELLRAVRAETAQIDPDVALFRATTMEGYLGRALAVPRLIGTLLAGFSALALTLAAIGVYGLISHAASRRLREVGIRFALGAQRRDIVRLLVGNGLRPTLIGVAFGLAAALALGRLANAYLYQVSPVDPWSFAVSAALLLAVAALASWIPAARASRAKPIEVLRYD